MIARSLRRFTRALTLPLVLTAYACGDGSGSIPSENSSARRQATTGVEVAGNVASGSPDGGSVLVFARTGAGSEPVSVGLIGQDGDFTLSALPAGSLELVFLNDTASDGVIDSGDAIAVLADPSLRGLQDGDRVRAADIQLDFRGHKAKAAGIEVVRSGSAEPPVAATPTAIP